MKPFNWESIIKNKLHEVRRIQNPAEHQRWDFLQKLVNYFRKKLHLRCLTGFLIFLCGEPDTIT